MNFEKIQSLDGQKQNDEAKLERINIEYAEISERAESHANEDRVLTLPSKGVIGIFDGAGGHSSGEIASKMARDFFAEEFNRPPRNTLKAEMAEIIAATNLLHEKIKEYGHKNQESYGLCTTMSLVRIFEVEGGSKKAIITNAGDSPVYLIRGGKMEQISTDDMGPLLEYESAEKIQEWKSKLLSKAKDELSDEENSGANLYRNSRNQISQSLGGTRRSELNPHQRVVDLQEGDIIIVMSDGISDNLLDKEILEAVSQGGNLQMRLENLHKLARARSKEGRAISKDDDMSSVAVRIAGGENLEEKREEATSVSDETLTDEELPPEYRDNENPPSTEKAKLYYDDIQTWEELYARLRINKGLTKVKDGQVVRAEDIIKLLELLRQPNIVDYKPILSRIPNVGGLHSVVKRLFNQDRRLAA